MVKICIVKISLEVIHARVAKDTGKKCIGVMVRDVNFKKILMMN